MLFRSLVVRVPIQAEQRRGHEHQIARMEAVPVVCESECEVAYCHTDYQRSIHQGSVRRMVDMQVGSRTVRVYLYGRREFVLFHGTTKEAAYVS